MKLIRKAVFPVAGLGSRFLPATKASPKEMLPIVDKPLIQYAVEEALSAGIEELVFVTSGAKRAIEDHFDRNFELEHHLLEAQKFDLLKQVRESVPEHVSCVYIRQAEPLGLGHAVWCARHVIGNEPFAVLLADDLIWTPKESCLEQMVAEYQAHHCGILAVQTVRPSETKQYGIVEIDESHKISAIIEKPDPDKAPSNLAVVGRYLLPSEIFECLEKTQRGTGGEIQLTDAISLLLQQKTVMTHMFVGTRYDCGSKLGYLKANVEYGLLHKDVGPGLKEYLVRLASELK